MNTELLKMYPNHKLSLYPRTGGLFKKVVVYQIHLIYTGSVTGQYVTCSKLQGA